MTECRWDCSKPVSEHPWHEDGYTFDDRRKEFVEAGRVTTSDLERLGFKGRGGFLGRGVFGDGPRDAGYRR